MVCQTVNRYLKVLVWTLLEDRKDSLFVQHVGYPENTSSLFDFRGVETEVGTLLVKTNAMRKSHGGGNEEVGRLWIRRSEKEETLNTLDEKMMMARDYIPLLAKPGH